MHFMNSYKLLFLLTFQKQRESFLRWKKRKKLYTLKSFSVASSLHVGREITRLLRQTDFHYRILQQIK